MSFAETLDWLAVRLRRGLGHLCLLPWALDLVREAAGGRMLAWAAVLVAQGLLPVATVHLTARVADAVVAAVSAGGDVRLLRSPLMLLGALALVLVLGEALGRIDAWLRTAQGELIHDDLRSRIQRKSIGLDLAFHDSPEFQDQLHRARADAGHRPIALLGSLGAVAQNGLTLLAMIGVLVPFGLAVPAALCASSLPAFWVVIHWSAKWHQWRLRTTPAERRTWHLDWLLTSPENAAELRLFDLGPRFEAEHRRLRDRLREGRLELERSEGIAEIAAGSFALAVSGGAVAWMAWRAIRGGATVGELVLFQQAFSQGQSLVRALLGEAGQIYRNLLFLENLHDLLELEPRLVDPAEPEPTPETVRRAIHFRAVDFRYPGSERPALDGLDVELRAGEIAAIVGANGAGKSTIAKLLCRFYDPDCGSIEIDGVDLRAMKGEDLRRRISVLFQEPVRHHATAAENIALGDYRSAPDSAAIEEAARGSGADAIIRRLPSGYETVLGKWLGGEELSLGEWQRLALARAFLRRAPILILDEPTSAMDSWAEADWLERLRALARGQTALLITHRFTTAMRADVIHVMEEGRIVESGTHDELVRSGGRYAVSWRMQMMSPDDGRLRHVSV